MTLDVAVVPPDVEPFCVEVDSAVVVTCAVFVAGVGIEVVVSTHAGLATTCCQRSCAARSSAFSLKNSMHFCNVKLKLKALQPAASVQWPAHSEEVVTFFGWSPTRANEARPFDFGIGLE